MIVSPDTYLITESGEYVWSPERAKAAWAKSYARLDALLASGQYNKVVLMIGIPASGKTTWLAANEEPDAIYFDATFIGPKSRAPVIEKAKAAGLRVEAVVAATPLAVCLERNRCRPEGRRVPEEAVERMSDVLERNPPRRAEGFDDITYIRRNQPPRRPQPEPVRQPGNAPEQRVVRREAPGGGPVVVRRRRRASVERVADRWLDGVRRR